MSGFKTLASDLEEFKALQEYHSKITEMLKLICEKDVTCVLSLGIVDQKKPAVEPKIKFKGQELSFDGFPEDFKKFPFLVFPGAELEKAPKYDKNFDLDIRPTLMVPFLTYLLRHINKRIEHLASKFSTYDKTKD